MPSPVALSVPELEAKAKIIRQHIVKITTEAGSGHPSSSLSAVEVVTSLFFGGLMDFTPQNVDHPSRDRFILSKGHAVPVLYAAMCEKGFYTFEQIMTLRKLGSPFEGHPVMNRLKGMEASTGSLGQGLSIGVGHALACRMDKLSSHVFVMCGDGEMGEGQVWEALATAHKYKLDNLTLIIDQNGFQQTGATKDVLDLREFEPKLAAFGWNVQAINGNDMGTALKALQQAKAHKGGPSAIVSRTQKGFGILPVLEAAGDLNYHGKPLSKDLAQKALALLG